MPDCVPVTLRLFHYRPLHAIKENAWQCKIYIPSINNELNFQFPWEASCLTWWNLPNKISMLNVFIQAFYQKCSQPGKTVLHVTQNWSYSMIKKAESTVEINFWEYLHNDMQQIIFYPRVLSEHTPLCTVPHTQEKY